MSFCNRTLQNYLLKPNYIWNNHIYLNCFLRQFNILIYFTVSTSAYSSLFSSQSIYYWNNESGSFFITKSRAASQFQVKINWMLCFLVFGGYCFFPPCLSLFVFVVVLPFVHWQTLPVVTCGVKIILTSYDTLSQADFVGSSTCNQKCFFKKKKRNVFPAHFVTSWSRALFLCEECEESSCFRTCGSPAEECSVWILPLSSEARELLFILKRRVSYIIALMLIDLFALLIIKMWPPIDKGTLYWKDNYYGFKT